MMLFSNLLNIVATDAHYIAQTYRKEGLECFHIDNEEGIYVMRLREDENICKFVMKIIAMIWDSG